MPDAGIVPSAQADGKVRQLAGGTRVASLTHCGKTASGTSAALGPGSLIRWAHRRRQSAADVPCARCRHRAVGLGRRQGPAASPTGVLTRVVKPQAQVSGTSTMTANHCKGPRRYQCLSRLGRSHTRARTLACPPRCAGMARAEYHRHARSASCCCENMHMQGGEG